MEIMQSPEKSKHTIKLIMNACSIDSWYKDFENVTIRTSFINLPREVVTYLKDEVFVLPKGTTNNDSDNEPELDEIPQPEFTEFCGDLKAMMKTFNMSTFIKTNWHSPKDAIWLKPFENLEFSTLESIFLLLKGSQLTKSDLEMDLLPGFRHILAMREFKTVDPDNEFRCFVYKHRLIGISSRNYVTIPVNEMNILEIRNDILKFFNKRVKNHFFLSNYIFDVIIKKTIILVDFSPFLPNFIDELAFSWPQLWKILVESPEKEPQVAILGTLGQLPGPNKPFVKYPTDISQYIAQEDLEEDFELKQNMKNILLDIDFSDNFLKRIYLQKE